MNRPFLACILFAVASAAAGAQQSQQNPYAGTSNPPADDAIVTTSTPPAKPPAGQPLVAAQPAPVAPQPSSSDPAVNSPAGTDANIVQGVQPAQPDLVPRAYADDPDGDIVHPGMLQPGELGEGTTIRVRLLDRLSTVDTEKGEPFRSQVASDVLQGGQVLIPAGAEIDGRVVEVSTGHPGGTGTMRLHPDTVILADGTRYRLFAELTGAPGSNTRIGGEGTIRPNSRLKRDGIEYGGAVGAGVVTGAILAGPAGALTGGLIGAGAVTTHLLVSHPQATLEPGTTLLFTLTAPLHMTAAGASGN
jgi:hypothetical protein